MMRWRWYKWLSRNRNNNECNYWSISPPALQKRERSMGHMLMSFPTEDLYRFSFLDISLTEIKGEFHEICVNVNVVIRRFCGGLMGHGLVGKIGDIKAM